MALLPLSPLPFPHLLPALNSPISDTSHPHFPPGESQGVLWFSRVLQLSSQDTVSSPSRTFRPQVAHHTSAPS